MRIGTTAATNVVVVSATQITCTLPAMAGAFGFVAVSVTHPDMQSVTRSDLFSYNANTLSFAAAASFGSFSQTTGLALSDLNGDSRLDLITANSGSGNVSVLLNTSQ